MNKPTLHRRSRKVREVDEAWAARTALRGTQLLLLMALPQPENILPSRVRPAASLSLAPPPRADAASLEASCPRFSNTYLGGAVRKPKARSASWITRMASSESPPRSKKL